MNRIGKVLLLLTVLSSGGAQAARPVGISLVSSIETSVDPLTTEGVWVLRPDEPNPHRQAWVLEHKLKWEGLEAFERAGASSREKFGVRAKSLVAQFRLYVRPEGLWFAKGLRYPTRVAAVAAGEKAAAAAEASLRSKLLRLQLLMERVKAHSRNRALAKGQLLLELWRKEWEETVAFGGDLAASTTTVKRQIYETLDATEKKDLVARAPSRIHGDYYTVRMQADFGGQVLNGRFLLDSAAAETLVSREWMISQGVNPAFLEIQGERSRRVSWLGGSAVAKPVYVFDAAVSNLSLPLSQLALIESTEVFAPPKFAASCCDGALGIDFMRHFAVELIPPAEPGAHPEVLIYQRQGFRLSSDTPWAELFVGPRGMLLKDGKPFPLALKKLSGRVVLDLPHGRVWFPK